MARAVPSAAIVAGPLHDILDHSALAQPATQVAPSQMLLRLTLSVTVGALAHSA